MTEPSLPSPDLLIVIRRIKPDDSRELGFEVSSPKQELGLNFWNAGSVQLTQEPEDYVRQLVRDIADPTLGSADEEIARQRMWAKGGMLFESLFPEKLRHLLWPLRGKISTLQILSDEPHIPWELTRLRSHEGGKTQEGGFLCEEFVVTRWLRGIPETHALSVRRLALVVPTSSQLASAADERDDMLALGSAVHNVIEIPPRYLDVTRELAGGTFDAWHFAGHGETYGDDPNLWRLELDDYPLRPEDMGTAAGNLGASQRPLLFFNGCHTARGGWALAGLGGWPPVLLSAGAGAFIGSLWKVKDKPARAFAKTFYERFLTGTPIGEAVRQARLRIRDAFPGEPTWLAYTVFAHPMTTCFKGIELPPPPPPPGPLVTPRSPKPEKGNMSTVEGWHPLRGRIGVSAQWSSSWIDLPSPTDFKKGDKIRLKLGGRAARIMIRFLPAGVDPNQPIGMVANEPFEIPPNKTVELTLPEDRQDVVQISVHGGPNPWGAFPLGLGNGAVTLESVARLAFHAQSGPHDEPVAVAARQASPSMGTSGLQPVAPARRSAPAEPAREGAASVVVPFAWQKSFLHAIQTHDVVILHGNIRDLYICRDGQRTFEEPLDNTLTRLLSTIDLRTLRLFDPHRKAAELTVGEAGNVVAQPLEDFGAPSFNDTTDTSIARIFAELTGGAQRQAWLLKQMHNLLPYRSGYSPQDNMRLVVLQNLIEGLTPGNKLLLCYLSDTQVPVELAQQLHRVAFVKVPLPDYEERCDFWQRAVDPSLATDLAKLTDGLALSSLQCVAELGRMQPAANPKAGALSLRDWERVISRFKLGEDKDPFRQITVEQLDHAFDFFTEQEGIQGQEEAVAQAVAMLWKARTDVSALLRTDPAGAPRGCLFFCGPSGVGKTMLAKKIAKFVFGSESAFLRIDMSEYQQDFTVSRLIGAPPGYVGHEAGGVLTNAMAERPFSVVLFDEIEKAHPRVFDLFLQVLSDGRLTDSRGQTVYFSEAILVFTSNLGTRSKEMPQLAEARQSGDPAKVRAHFLQSVRDFFRSEISRPELLNRIGNNIVPFNYLDQQDVLVRTVRFYLEMLRRRFDEEHAERRLSLTVDTDAVANFLVEERGTEIRELGGKAVLNTLDDALMPALARRLLILERSQSPGRVILHVDVGVESNARRIRVRQ